MNRHLPDGKKSGIALVLVLSVLALITVLIVAFFTTVNGQFNRSQAYARSNSTQQFTDVPIRLVMSQIKQATSNGTTVAWASQPGMIRTYSNTGNPLAYYKLYSSDTMQLSGTAIGNWQATSTTSTDLPASANWATANTALYTDLNAPIYQNGTAHYPVLDPGVLTATNPVKGFSLASSPAASNSTVTGTAAAMPVEWLYVLQDGTVIAPDASSTTVATFTSAAVQPSASNPIVGRVAFWTDDDTCKVDINTAAGTDWTTATTGTAPGSYWTKPVVDTFFDRALATNQPVAGEYQRYPGHPARTLLSAVFPGLTSTQIYSLVPRVSAGTHDSQGGTVPISSNSTATVLDQDRLYSTVDDLIFNPARAQSAGLSASQVEQARFFLTTRSVAPEVNLYNLPRISMWPVSSTANQRTATDNLFALSSTLGNSTVGTAFPYYIQRSTAMSQTTDLPGGSTTTGLGRNRGLLEYVRTLTSLPVPGFGGNFASKYNATDSGGGGISGTERDQILTEIIDYIRDTNIFDPTASAANIYAPYGLVLPTLDTTNGTQGFGRWPVLNEAGLAFIGVADHFNPSPDSRDPANLKGAAPIAGVPYVPATPGPVPPASPAIPSIAVRAGFVVNFFIPAAGLPIMNPTPGKSAIYTLTVTGLDALKWKDNSNPFAAPVSMGFSHIITYTGGFTFLSGYGRAGGVDFLQLCPNTPANNCFSTPLTMNFKQNQANSGIVVTGAPITVTLTTTTPASGVNVPSVTFNYPSGTFPVPQLAPLHNYTPPVGPMVVDNWALFSARNDSGADCWDDTRDVIRTVIDDAANCNYDHRLLAARHNVTILDNLFSASTGYPAMNVNLADSLATGQSVTRSTNFGCYAPGIPNMGANGYFACFPDGSPSASSSPPSATVVPALSAGVDSVGGQYFTYAAGAKVPLAGNLPDGTNGVARGTDTEKNITVFTALHQIPGGTYAYLYGTTTLGDWDNGNGSDPDGPYINKADEGAIYDQGSGSSTRTMPYFFNQSTFTNPTATFFIPNREVPSSMMLGSLSTGVVARQPWQTLEFRPGPTGHPGLGTSVSGGGDSGPPYSTPPDHLIADLFYMPVVQPYPISEPLATAGKVNMNYQIVPFTYITRSTGMQSVLAAEQMLAIPNSQAVNYKLCGANGRAQTDRFTINLPETLKGFQDRFDNGNSGKGDIFRSATEICHLWLVPNDGSSTYNNNFANGAGDTWWKGYVLTGDNSKERPYADIYAHLTTKSNTYTVHYKVQALQKVSGPGSNPAQWVDGTDIVLGEQRGSTSIERYVDPNDPNLSLPANDFVSNVINNTPVAVDNFYKFRILSTRRFSITGQ